MLGFFRNNLGFGGNNGLTDFKDILGFNVQAQETRAALFVDFLRGACARLSALPRDRDLEAGKVLVAIRDAEAAHAVPRLPRRILQAVRVHALGRMAGVAGALYVPQVGIINPSEFAPANSIEAVIWVAVGGRGTLTGAVIGAVLVNYAKTTFTSGVLAPILAVHAGRPVRRGDAAAASRHRRHLAVVDGTPPRVRRAAPPVPRIAPGSAEEP